MSAIPPGFDAAGFRQRAQGHDPEHAFGAEPAHLGHGDHVLNPGMLSALEEAKLRDAAVLVPVIGSKSISRSANPATTLMWNGF